jgi:CubicO group peptidase (beta-lactamase class C family)
MNTKSQFKIDDAAEAPPDSGGLTSSQVQAIWTKVEALYSTGIYPAISFSLQRKGKVMLQRALGFARGGAPRENAGAEKIPMTPDTPVCLFSTSKAVTATLMHALHERGALNLNQRVAEYIPQFDKKGKGNITISDVLSHRAGFSGFKRQGMSSEIFNFDHIVEVLCDQGAELHTKGAVAYHAVTGGYILGEIAKRATGKDLRENLHEIIKKPLGFDWFDYGAPGRDLSKIAQNYVTGWPQVFPIKQIVEYAIGGSFETIVGLARDERFYTSIVPSANMVATAPEVARFFQMLLGGGALNGVRICKEETVREMARETGNTWFDRRLMMPMRYSQGFMLGNSPLGLYGPDTKQAFGHLGFMNILCWADPQRDISVALLNTGKSLGGRHVLAFADLLRTIAEECR